ncbi:MULTISPECIES: hypothetical protein, partial [Spirulina sp. CCY15215]|uniref:hypothetical protein n=1 Tax=Spirulina sp. CCY15215 TaxID=2767591 RepID=UPI00194FD05C
FYGVPQGEGEFSLEKIEQEGYSIFFVGSSMEEVQTAINNNRIELIQLIELVAEDYQGFNILKVGDRFY